MNFWKIGAGVLASAYTVASLAAVTAKVPAASFTTKPLQADKVILADQLHLFQELARKKTEAKQQEQVTATTVPESVLELTGFQLTWYNNQYDHTDITATGTVTTPGRTASVDPEVIPLGTWFEILMPDGTVLKRRAEDTGGAVHGRILDVYADQPDSILKARGRTYNVTVRILKGE